MSNIKLTPPHIIEATYRIVTPMFIGDADQKASCISPVSVKGALRFWWRALNWGKIRNEIDSDTAALQRLHQQESELFGTSADNGRAAAFTLRVNAQTVALNHSTDWPRGRNDPSGYLGLGLWESGSRERGNFQAHREYIAEGQNFSVSLIASTNLSNDIMQQLRDALSVWGLFGGLGSRARRAFGSVAIQSLDQTTFLFSTVNDYKQVVDKLLSSYRLASIKQPPFTAISQDTQFSISNNLQASARLAHANLGAVFRDYRGQPSDLRGSKKRVFGMPYAGGTRAENEARRASPLLFHVHPIGSKFVGTVLFLPAVFHHEQALENVDYLLASGFLKQLPAAVFA